MADVKQVFSKIGGVLKSVAPSLATALGGPLAGLATSAICKAVGGDPAADPGAVEQQILAQQNPDLLLKLRQADQEFAAQMKQLDIDLEKIAEQDRESARARESTVRDWTPRVLAYATTIGFFSLLFYFCSHEIPAGSKTQMDILLGMLATAWTAIMTYYFGSSAGSARKTELMTGGAK